MAKSYRFNSTWVNPDVCTSEYPSRAYFFRHVSWRFFLKYGVKLGDRNHLVSVALGYHSLQCDQRWWGVRVGRYRLAYRTRGDASRHTDTYYDGGMWWPWHTRRTCAGCWL